VTNWRFVEAAQFGTHSYRTLSIFTAVSVNQAVDFAFIYVAVNIFHLGNHRCT